MALETQFEYGDYKENGNVKYVLLLINCMHKLLILISFIYKILKIFF